jgi:hypothetical protein
MQRRRLIATAIARRGAIIGRYSWPAPDVWEDSPQRIDTDLAEFDPRWFLGSLFPPTALVWSGEIHESGQCGRHAGRWQTCGEWQSHPDESRIGPMVTPAIWKSGSTSRTAERVLAAPYVVLDFDGIDGVKPETPDQLRQHLADSLGCAS